MGILAVLKLQTGKLLWEANVAIPPSGVSLWKQTKLQARGITAPVIVGNYLAVGDIEGYVHWMRRDNGEFVARYRTGSKSINVPPLAVDEQRILVYSSRGELQLLRLSGK